MSGSITGIQKSSTKEQNKQVTNQATVQQTTSEGDGALVIDMPQIDKLIDIAGTITYIGSAHMGADTSEPVWAVKRINTGSNPITIGYAYLLSNSAQQHKGDNRFIWDDRASLTYTR